MDTTLKVFIYQKHPNRHGGFQRWSLAKVLLDKTKMKFHSFRQKSANPSLNCIKKS